MSICSHFRQTTLRKKFIYVFSATTLLTVLAVIVLIEVQLMNIKKQTTYKLDGVHQVQINASSTNNVEALLISYEVILNSYADKVRQLVASYNFFTLNSDLYSSNQFSNAPVNCSSLSGSYKNYSFPCIYNYNGNSMYQSGSFFDMLLPTLLPYNKQYVKRINIIYYNNSNNNVSTVRTYPATQISLNNLTQIQVIYYTMTQNYITISTTYDDVFSNSNTTLVALSTFVNTSDPNIQIIIQIEMIYSTIVVLYRNILYFPGSIIIYSYYNPPVTGPNVMIISMSNTSFNDSTAQQSLYEIITKNQSLITIQGTSYYASWINFAQSLPINNSQLISVVKNPKGNFYFTQLVPSEIMDGPYNMMKTYLKKQSFIIGLCFGFTSLIAFLTVVSFSFMASNGISSRLSKISKGMNKYLHGQDHNAVTIKLKKLAAQNLIKTLVQNILNLIRKIEENKAQFANTTSTYKYQYPENQFDIDFLRRINSKSADLWPTVQTKLMNKYPEAFYQMESGLKRNERN